MTFFNKKTDVINFELTPLGRELLAQGKLKPKHYEFVDDDILYDIAYDGTSTETQESAHNRIVNETPRLKNILIKSGVESNFIIKETAGHYNDRIYNRRLTYDQKSYDALGQSSYVSDMSPSFQVQMLKGEISSSANYLTSSVVTHLPIPQVEIDVALVLSTGSVALDDRDNLGMISDIYPDGKFIIMETEFPLIHLKEFGSFYEKENFEIEVYSIESDTIANQQTVEKLVPLLFAKEHNHIKNGIYLEEEPIEGDPEVVALHEEVSYYFDILVDDEIPREEICEAVEELSINSQFLDKELLCPDKRTDRFNLYGTQVTDSDIEDCD
tara:strand:+ start:1953 stop:2933 length:981 start_codon:yes stop_codon:yes gene_type:complete